MAYLHTQKNKDKNYYSLRSSERKGKKIITKILYNFGTEISKKDLDKINKKIKIENKNLDKIQGIIEKRYFSERAKKQSIKKDKFLDKKQIIETNTIISHFISKRKKKISDKFFFKFYKERVEFEENKVPYLTVEQFKIFEKSKILPKNKEIKLDFFLHVYMSTNLKKIFDFLETEKPKLDLRLIAKIHDIYLENIFKQKGFRNQNIKIPKNPFKPSKAKDLEKDLKILLKWFNKQKNKISPLILSTLFFHKFEKIHPFFNGNGAIGRILMNYILFLSDFPPVIINWKYKNECLKLMNLAYKSTKKDLLEVNLKYYKPLIDFMHEQFCKTYWEILICTQKSL